MSSVQAYTRDLRLTLTGLLEPPDWPLASSIPPQTPGFERVAPLMAKIENEMHLIKKKINLEAD
jgi:hypothetical protein